MDQMDHKEWTFVSDYTSFFWKFNLGTKASYLMVDLMYLLPKYTYSYFL